jgi:hypothetical protein
MKTCPKCDAPIRERSNGQLKCVDVAHSGEDLEQALHKLERAIDDAIHGNFRGIKVIHGRGSTTGISRIKPHILASMKRAARDYDGKVVADRDNPGAHLLWFD